MLSRRDRQLGAIARAADLVVADGTGVLLASRLLGDPLPSRVPGRLLVPAILGRIAPLGGSGFLLGAGPGGAERAGAELARRIPLLRVVGTYAGTPSPGAGDPTREPLRRAAPP